MSRSGRKVQHTGNKQRLVRLSEREKRATQMSGWVDERIPVTELRRRLKPEPAKFETKELFAVLASRVGMIRLLATAEANHLEPKEIAGQAAATMDVIEELLVRLEFMHPQLEALVDARLFRGRETCVLYERERVGPSLRLVSAGLAQARALILARKGAPGRKWNQYRGALTEVAKSVRASSTPQLSLRASRALAADLIALCLGENSPRKSP